MSRGYKWYPIPKFDDKYLINKKGEVLSLNYRRTNKRKILKCIPDKDGYLTIMLCLNGIIYNKKIHRILCEIFKPRVNDLIEVNHKDGNKKNNNLNNLEWCTKSYNIKHSIDTGLKPKTTERQRMAIRETNKRKMKKVFQYSLNNKYINEYESIMAASKATNLNNSNIGKCCNGILKKYGNYIWSFNKL